MASSLAAPAVERVPPEKQSAKRLFDVAIAAVLLALALAPMLLICCAIKCSTGGPVLFGQRRVGRHGRQFLMWKFRTMHHGAHAARAAIAHRNESDGCLFKIRHDPRITPFGRYLRMSSLDELPQLVNVLRGEMSLVGPRPLLVEDSHYEGEARDRLLVRPGVTGLWQVSGRSDLAWADMVRLDLHYVRHRTARLDLKILCRTVPAVLTARGAR